MVRFYHLAAGALLVGLMLAGCNPGDMTGATQATAPGQTPGAATSAPETTPEGATTEAVLPTSETAETTEATTAATPTLLRSPTTVGTPEAIQSERIVVDATGELEPATIDATAGVTLELMLTNRSESDALLVFDLSPTGAMGIMLPATLAITNTPSTVTPTTALRPTATEQLLLQPTRSATSVATGTSETEATPEATPQARTIGPTEELTTTATATPAGLERVVYLRYDQAGSYQVRCGPVPATDPSSISCTGSVTIVVESAAPAATRTPTGAIRTPAITGTAQLSETPTLTTTAGTRTPTSATATTEQRTPETPTLTTTAGTRTPTSATATTEQRTPETTATARPTP
jgi:hypothetical protein